MKTSVLKIDPKNPDREKIDFASRILRDGGLVAFPTETVYGLGANLLDGKAIEKLYTVKRRPKTKPFTVHISSLKTIKELNCKITKEAKTLIDRFWPGPLTIVLRSKNGKKIGFRMPDDRIALELIERSKVPIVAPSANISGKSPPRSAREVLRYLGGKIDILLDGGKPDIGVESTVVDLTVKPPKILREGAVTRGKLEKVLAHSS